MRISGVATTIKKALGLTVEHKSYSLRDPAVAEIFGVRQTSSGVAINGRTALAVPAVLQAVRLISETIGSLPCKLYLDTDGSKAADKEHPAYRIVHSRANEWTGAGDRVSAGAPRRATLQGRRSTARRDQPRKSFSAFLALAAARIWLPYFVNRT